ncbi:Glucose transport transcription regulator RGT1 [Madurella mycetomatis]|uniref:Glucose transport transcription regulator RGT1 n=1 Tax=Madurella mycetomatis TaxID=100816 RepID=A0A175W644_9PEZI|nr:Glucose transport transcription regulator RGT1 [Madurella mycetomatis]
MGFASYFEPRFRSAIPDTPPEVLTPDSASFPSRQSEERSWNPPAPPSPPMSNYDPTVKASDMSSSGKGPEETPARGEGSSDQPAPRQQLPSLSSLFGPAPPINPLHLPFSDRSGTYSASPSPLDRPFSGPSSYFPPPTTSSTSQPRITRDSRFQDRSQIPPLSQVFSGPFSPQPRPEQPRSESRPDHSPGSQWLPPYETGREYALGSREQPQLYRSAGVDRYPARLPGTGGDEGRRPDFRDQLVPQTPAHNPPATPTSSVGSESAPSKDGLGPKIWTGTHFLPRFVRTGEVPGEGLCYFYDDGSHCKTVIDGEAVNAHWGVTKAGKPRKRLAIACITCREKKIKCEPDYPRCVQCEKFGRVCKFKNAPRGGHNTSPSTPPAEPEDVRRLGGMVRPSTDLARNGHSSESVSPRTTLRPVSPDQTNAGPLKRVRVGYDHYSPTAGTRSPMPPMAPTSDAARPSLLWRQPESLPRIHEDVLCRAWQPDPRPDALSHTAAILLQLVHSRIVLATNYLAVSQPGNAKRRDERRGFSSDMPAIEPGIELGFAESRNGTFRSCLLPERLNGLFSARAAIIHGEDI